MARPSASAAPPRAAIDRLIGHFRASAPDRALAEARAFGRAWPRDFGAQSLLGGLYAQIGRFDLAEPALRAARTMRPDDAQTRLMHGVVLFELDRFDEARVALSALAGHPEADTVLGLSLHALERFADAVAALQRAVSRDPANVRAWNNLGANLMGLRRYDEAEGALQRALALAPDYVDAALNLADVWIERGESARSLDLLAHHLSRDPANPDLLAKRGDALVRGGAADAAVETYRAVLAIAPGRAETHNALAKAWHRLGDLDAALEAYRRARDLDPGNALYHADLGVALEEAGERLAGIAALARSLELDGTDDFVLARLYGCRMQVCDWQAIPAIEQRLPTIGTGDIAVSPFALITIDDDPARALARARRHARKYDAIRPAPLAVAPAADGRIRVGYFSADFHDHATMLLMAGLFRTHDRARFEITAFSYGPPRDDDARRNLLDHVERFVDVRAMPNDAIVALARQSGPDIAVDLKGYTQNSRIDLFAHRLAPVQINWLGFPGTCGTSFHDYLIGDAVVTPLAAQAHYSENLLLLPGSYQCNDDARPIADWRPARAELGLPDTGFVFACFNHLYKITPDIFAIWTRLLHAVPGSVLWLLGSNPEAEANLRAAASAHGLDPARLVFAGREPNPRHLARMAVADLFLDTFPCNAHTTASDALWAGLPLITRMGESFPARVAASLLTACGLPDLIATSHADYEALALSLAHDPARLAAVRAQLARRAALPLFDTARFTRDLERAFAAIHQRRIDGLPPAPMALTA